MADINKWDLLSELGFPASYGYRIPTGGAKPNIEYEKPSTYLNKLGAQRTEYPPVNWDDQPYKLGINPDMLNDPAFSEYDFSQLRTFKEDPRLRDEIDLGIVGSNSASQFATSPNRHAKYAGFTYMPGLSPYDPNKVYVDELNKLKMAVGPGVEQTKQGIKNKEIASTISHEFRHNMFDDPKYSGIIDAAFNRFGGWGGNISRYDLEEYINRAADAQLMPETWKADTLDDYEDEYNLNLRNLGYPEHLTRANTTNQFHRAAKEFFEKVRRQKLKRPTQRNIQKRNIGMPEHLTTYTPPKKPYVTPPRGGGADVMPTPPPKKTYVSPARPHGNGGGRRPDKPGGFTDPGKGSYGPHMAAGGLMDIPLPGRRRDI